MLPLTWGQRVTDTGHGGPSTFREPPVQGSFLLAVSGYTVLLAHRKVALAALLGIWPMVSPQEEHVVCSMGLFLAHLHKPWGGGTCATCCGADPSPPQPQLSSMHLMGPCRLQSSVETGQTGSAAVTCRGHDGGHFSLEISAPCELPTGLASVHRARTTGLQPGPTPKPSLGIWVLAQTFQRACLTFSLS